MWIVIITVLIILAIFYFICRLFWTISKPLFVYLYQRILNALISTGMTEQAAKATISGVILLLILLVILASS